MIAIHVSGSNTAALAIEAEAFLQDAFQQRPERAVVPPEEAPTRTDPLAVVLLLLSVPGAVLATSTSPSV